MVKTDHGWMQRIDEGDLIAMLHGFHTRSECSLPLTNNPFPKSRHLWNVLYSEAIATIAEPRRVHLTNPIDVPSDHPELLTRNDPFLIPLPLPRPIQIWN